MGLFTFIVRVEVDRAHECCKRKEHSSCGRREPHICEMKERKKSSKECGCLKAAKERRWIGESIVKGGSGRTIWVSLTHFTVDCPSFEWKLRLPALIPARPCSGVPFLARRVFRNSGTVKREPTSHSKMSASESFNFDARSPRQAPMKTGCRSCA